MKSMGKERRKGRKKRKEEGGSRWKEEEEGGRRKEDEKKDGQTCFIVLFLTDPQLLEGRENGISAEEEGERRD
jgi:hypothetical protein